MAQKRITEITLEATTPKSDHYFPVDHETDGTQKMSLETLLSGVMEDMGDLTDLDTTEKASLVNAINEVAGATSDIEIYVEGNTLVINTMLVDGNEVEY